MKMEGKKCSNCGGVLEKTSTLGVWRCPFCDTIYDSDEQTYSVESRNELFKVAVYLLNNGQRDLAQRKFAELREKFPRFWGGWYADYYYSEVLGNYFSKRKMLPLRLHLAYKQADDGVRETMNLIDSVTEQYNADRKTIDELTKEIEDGAYNRKNHVSDIMTMNRRFETEKERGRKYTKESEWVRDLAGRIGDIDAVCYELQKRKDKAEKYKPFSDFVGVVLIISVIAIVACIILFFFSPSNTSFFRILKAIGITWGIGFVGAFFPTIDDKVLQILDKLQELKYLDYKIADLEEQRKKLTDKTYDVDWEAPFHVEA